PLASYIRQNWRPLPEVDTSGGNVTFSAVALAEKLGAQSIELYGADFSYPEGLTYAGETYIHQLFANKQKRLAPLEAQHSAFLYRGPLVKKTEASGWYYESPSLKFYREKLQEKSRTMEAELLPQQGIGAPIMAPVRPKKPEPKHQFSLFTSGRCQLRAEEFLGLYRDNIGRLPFMKNTAAFQTLRENEKQIFTTILPAAAAIKRRNPGLTSIELIEETKKYCLKEIEKVLNSGLYSC
ncbi:MAG: hypothetical protein FWF22_11195, partial [Treponema sp.]|nr:hypothetical protein [Treponema sp.]